MSYLLEKFRVACLLRGANGIVSIGKLFRIMDNDNDKKLSIQEFKEAMTQFGILFTDTEIATLFKQYDEDGTGQINYDEFLVHLRPPMSQRRVELVNRAFTKMDRNRDGVITVEDLVGVYTVKNHTRFQNGDWTEGQCLRSFLNTFDTTGKDDGVVTREEFLHYYSCISASIDTDGYFDLMMRNTWKLD